MTESRRTKLTAHTPRKLVLPAIAMLASVGALLEAFILVGIVGIASDEGQSAISFASPIALTAAIAARYVVSRASIKLLNWEASDFRSGLSNQVFERYSSCNWVERQVLAPSEVRALSLFLPQDLSNSRHSLTVSVTSSASVLVLTGVALAVSPTAVVMMIPLAPILALIGLPRIRKASGASLAATRYRLSLSRVNEILVEGSDELRPSERLSNFKHDYRSLVQQEANSVRKLRDLDGLGPLQLTTIVFFALIAVVSVPKSGLQAEDYAAYLVLFRVALLFQPISQLPTVWSEFRALHQRFFGLYDLLSSTAEASHSEHSHRVSTSTRDVQEASGPIFKGKELQYIYSNGLAVGPFTFEIHEHELTCVIGRSGSGKSTLSRLLIGDLTPSTGTLIRRDDILNIPIRYVPQFPQLLEGDVKENVEFWLPNASKEQISQSLDLVGLSYLLDSNNQITEEPDQSGVDQSGEHRAVTRLSGGEKLRLGLARALLDAPGGILILDEPTSALDKNSKSEIIEYLGDLRRTSSVIAITHDQQLINAADRVIELG